MMEVSYIMVAWLYNFDRIYRIVTLKKMTSAISILYLNKFN